jgi:hypothetical protein
MLTDVDIRNLPEMLKKMMKSEKFNPQQLMQMVAPMIFPTSKISFSMLTKLLNLWILKTANSIGN